MPKKIKVVVACGTFDLLHAGHEFFLREAKKQGGKLVVVVARDANVRRLKKIVPHENEKMRLKKVANLGVADKVKLGREKDFWESVRVEGASVLAVGYDQALPPGAPAGLEVVRIGAFEPEKYKSSILRKKHARA